MYIIHVIMLIFAVIYANDCVTTQTNRPLSNYARKEQRRSWETSCTNKEKCKFVLSTSMLFFRSCTSRKWPIAQHGHCLSEIDPRINTIVWYIWRRDDMRQHRLQIMLRFILECKAYNRWQEISSQVTTMYTEKTMGRRFITPMTRDVSAKIR